MKKLTHIFLFCFLASYFLSLASNLSAQSGWSEDQRLTFDYAYSADPKAACDGDTIHLVWWKNYLDSLSNYRDEIFYKRSMDAGLTWGDDVLLSIEDDRSSVLPWIALNGNYLYVVWQQQDVGICYCKSTDSGNSWLPIDTIPNSGSGNPSICAVDSNVYVTAYRTDGKIIFSKSTDNGNTWLLSQEINFNTANKPRIKNLNSSLSILILSCENLTSSVEIYYRKSADAGETWSDSQCVSQYDSISSQRPAMDTDDSSGIHITWYDYKYSPYPWTGDIFYRASRDSGNSWEEIDSLTVMHRAVASDILAEGDNLHLVWEDDRHGFGNNFEIYYRMSTDLGQTWESEVRLTNASFHSRRPSLACDGDFLHLFWRDCRDSANNGIGFIYYKRKDLSSAVSENSNSGISKHLIILPNPFRNKTTISFFLPEASGILEVFNAIGQRVLIEELLGRGRKEVIWQTNNAGVYFVRLKTKNKVAIKKMVALK